MTRPSDVERADDPAPRRRGLGLRSRLSLWLGAIFCLLLLLDGAVLHLAVMPSFEQVEQAGIARGYDRTLGALTTELEALHKMSGDYANWDYTYDYASGEENGFTAAEDVTSTMANLDLGIYAVLDGAGGLRFGKLKGGDSIIPLPRELRPTLAELAGHAGDEDGKTGIAATTLGLWLVSTRPILHTDGSGPPAGVLVMARWFGDDTRALLGRRVREEVALWPTDGVELPAAAATALGDLVRSGATHLTRVEGEDRITVYGLLRDLAGEPALLLHVDRPRSTAQLGVQAVRLAAMGFALSVAVALVALSILLRRLVVGPLAALMAHMGEIRRTGDLSRPLAVEGKDEIRVLARGFDELRASLHAAHEELRDTFDSVGDLLFALDRELRFMIANRACLEAWGKRIEEVVGRPLLTVLPGLAGSACVDAMRRVLAGGPPERFEMFSPVMRCWVEFYATARRDGGIIVHLQDISARKEAERAKSQFLATMSHEIRTPLTAVLGFADLLARSELSPEQQEHLRIVRDTGRTLLAVVNDVLDFSKLEAGKMSLERIPVDLERLLREALAAIGLLGAEKGLTFQAEIDPALPRQVRTDSVRLKQIVGNLLSNALKFTGRGGVTLRARVVGRDDTAVRIRVEVEDTGIGIAPEQLPRLFAMFEQADQSTTRRFGGTGLGLAISKRLVEAMGGTIAVRSTPGEGSTFTFELPLEPAPAEETAPVPAVARVAPVRALNVLVADDVATNRILVSALLRRQGHAPHLAEDGVKAVEAAVLRRFDLILMDLHMPGMDGIMATRAIRTGGGPNARTPVVALSADVQPETAAACRAAGMDGSLAKPIEPERLLAVLAGVAASPVDEAA
jgi:PAS domain S-box-containing protein